MTTIYSHRDFNTFDVKEYLSSNDHYEEFDPTKEYSFSSFKHNYGKGIKTYELEKYVFTDYYDGDNEQVYIAAKEILTHEEITMLGKYCNCAYHKTNFIGKIFQCQCCVGCIEAGDMFYSQSIVNEARARMESGDEPNGVSSCIIL